jgi:D-alanyl-D-alanine carboxypeptidase
MTRLPPIALAVLVITFGVACAIAAPSLKPGAEAGDQVLVGGKATAFDEVPGVTNLDPQLLAALRRATNAAADEEVGLRVNSGWRSREHQERLWRDAIDKYGSAQEAARWVAYPATSVHVSGDGVDIAPLDAIVWLSEHGGTFGLCQIYDNEPWHFELRPRASEDGCPATYADPTQDPRMQ